MLVQIGTVLVIFSLPLLSENKRILAIMPTPSYSHQIVYNPLWLALIARGHHVTLLTTNPLKQRENLTQVDWSFAYDLWHRKHNASQIIKNFDGDKLKCLEQYLDMMTDIFQQELQHFETQKLIRNQSEHFDVVLAEILSPVMVVFARRFNCPLIGISPMDVTNFVHESFENAVSPALFPDFLSTLDSQMSFFERVLNTMYYLGSKVYFKVYFYPRMDAIVGKIFGNVPSLDILQRDMAMLFVNTNPVLHNIRPVMRNVLSIGGGSHFEQGGKLPQDIQTFLDEAKTGAIYFSMGSNVQCQYLSPQTIKIFVEAFTELPYKILWKFENTTLETSSNILVKEWAPQQQILKHPNMKLFITQGGLQSLEEAIFNQLPIVAIPIYVDQYSNVKKAVRKGLGIKLDLNTFDKDALKNAIVEVISNEKYKNSAKSLASLLSDQPISGLEEAVWWTEYVMKHKGAKFLKQNPIPLYQYLLLDVLLAFTLSTILVYFTLYKIIKLLITKKRQTSVELKKFV